MTRKEVVNVQDIADIKADDGPMGGSWIFFMSGSEMWVRESAVMLNIITEHHVQKQMVKRLLNTV